MRSRDRRDFEVRGKKINQQLSKSRKLARDRYKIDREEAREGGGMSTENLKSFNTLRMQIFKIDIAAHITLAYGHRTADVRVADGIRWHNADQVEKALEDHGWVIEGTNSVGGYTTFTVQVEED